MNHEYILNNIILLPSELVKSYQKIGLDNYDFIVLIQLIEIDKDGVPPKANLIIERTGLESQVVNASIQKLINQDLIKILKTRESYRVSFTNLYEKIYQTCRLNPLVLDIEKILERKISQTESEIINSWLIKNYDQSLIRNNLEKLESYNYDLSKISSIIEKISHEENHDLTQKFTIQESIKLF